MLKLGQERRELPIRRGKPYWRATTEFIPETIDDSNLITSRSEEEVIKIIDWIYENIIPTKRVSKNLNSKYLSELLENDIGINLTNNEFKDAMLFVHYLPVNPTEVNWIYKIKIKKN